MLYVSMLRHCMFIIHVHYSSEALTSNAHFHHALLSNHLNQNKARVSNPPQLIYVQNFIFLFNSIIHGNTTTINYLRRSNILLFSNQTYFYHVYQGMYLLFFGYPVITSCSVLLVHLIMFSICSVELVHTNPSNASHSSNTHVVSSNSTMQWHH